MGTFQNSRNTNQAHGSPGNLLDLYAAVDIPESETFGSTKFDIQGLKRNLEDINTKEVPDINMLKFASSAANITGKPLISNESFTWLTEHFKTSWSQVKPEAEQIFLSGINHIFITERLIRRLMSSFRAGCFMPLRISFLKTVCGQILKD